MGGGKEGEVTPCVWMTEVFKLVLRHRERDERDILAHERDGLVQRFVAHCPIRDSHK
jgi:hypothetical protein